MTDETVEVTEGSSTRCELGNLILSVRYISSSRECTVVIGRPGVPNLERKMSLGDVALYETSFDGILEVRLLEARPTSAMFLVSQITPVRRFAAGLVEEDPSNLPFSPSDLIQIKVSIASLKMQLANSQDFKPEQLDLITRKLDEIELASARLGRKDWMNYVAGTITSLCISAAFAPEQAKAIFKALNVALSWLFNHPPVFLDLS